MPSDAGKLKIIKLNSPMIDIGVDTPVGLILKSPGGVKTLKSCTKNSTHLEMRTSKKKSKFNDDEGMTAAVPDVVMHDSCSCVTVTVTVNPLWIPSGLLPQHRSAKKGEDFKTGV
jgi:hypothetical protein